MFNPKNFPILVDHLATTLGRRKARVLVKSIKLTEGKHLNDDDLFGAFAWRQESRGPDFWMDLHARIMGERLRRGILKKERQEYNFLKGLFKK